MKVQDTISKQNRGKIPHCSQEFKEAPTVNNDTGSSKALLEGTPITSTVESHGLKLKEQQSELSGYLSN